MTSRLFAEEHTRGCPLQSGVAHSQVSGWGAHGSSWQEKLKPAPLSMRTQTSSGSQVIPPAPHGVPSQDVDRTCQRFVCTLQFATDTTLSWLQRS
jgi:hypothetical protein